MSIISDYISEVKATIEKLPYVLSNELKIENRGDVVLHLKGKIIFTNQSELHFKEYAVSLPEFGKIAYSYHYQAADKRLLFRYDNAEHHPELENFPYHKHIGDKVSSAEEISLNQVLELVIDLIK